MRRVLRLIERTIDKRGQALLVPELTLEAWTTSLPARFGAQDVISLYADHGTHEQHSMTASPPGMPRNTGWHRL